MKRTTLASLIVLAGGLPALACGGGYLTAHEWGTFTSVQGSDGVQAVWNPFQKTDLPGFVYDRSRSGWPHRDLINNLTKDSTRTLIRMETPVIYFYSDKEMTVDVRVDFPKGKVTEWYPQATEFGPYVPANEKEKTLANKSFIEWKGVRILAPGTGEMTGDKLIREEGDNHYYAARETDANLIRVEARNARNGPEHDRMLFYRGVGSFAAPLTVRLSDEETMHLSSAGETLKNLFVLTVRNGEARYQHVDQLSPAENRSITLSAGTFAPLSDVRPRIMAEMEAALANQGLFAAEARAMVKTWKDHWFTEEGTRVLYLLSREWTDRTLPLEVKPRATSTVRVMVGRSEVITPDKERALHRSIASYHSGKAGAQQQAISEVRQLKLGRFLEPAVQQVLAGNADRPFANSAWKLASEAGVEPSGSAIGTAKSPEAASPRAATEDANRLAAK